jgi:adenylate kinase family enzyme
MKIALIGAPGSGKTTIARIISQVLKLQHIEGDKLFWNGNDLRTEVEKLTSFDNWVYEGHISKVGDIVLPRADKVIVIEGVELLNFFRSIKRDIKKPAKAWFNFQHYSKLSMRRSELIEELKAERLEDIISLNNFPNLSESYLAAFCEGLKFAPVKAMKKPVQRKRS